MRLALATGAIVGLLAPAVGFFLVERKASLVGDGLGHVAFAGVAVGYLLGVSPVLTALVAAVIGALTIEWLRTRGGTAGDQALALVFYTGIAAGVVLVSKAGALNVNLFQFLFGSILTVTRADLWTVLVLGIGALATIAVLFRGLVATVLDEEGSRVAGVPVTRLNVVVAVLAALTVAVSMRIVGILLIAALMVLPGDRGESGRLEPRLDVCALDGFRGLFGDRGPLDRVLRRPATRRHDRARRRRRLRPLLGRQCRRPARVNAGDGMIGSMRPVVLTGSDLTLEEVLAVARRGAPVEIDPTALARMTRAREVVDRAIAEGRPAYGVTTGVGSRKSFKVEAAGPRSPARAPAPDRPGLAGRARDRPCDGTTARERARVGDDRGATGARRARRRGAERRPTAGDPRAWIGRAERSGADGRSRRRDPRRLRARASARRSRCSTRAPSRRPSERSRSPTRWRSSMRSTARVRSISRHSVPTGTRCTPRSATCVRIQGSRSRSPACEGSSTGARSKRGSCRTRSASGPSRS